jgi:hypothetical protein
MVFAAIAAHLDAPGHQGQAAVAAYGVPVHFVLKALRFYAGRYASCGYGSIERGWLCGGRSAKPRGAAPELAAHYGVAPV